MPGGVLSQTRGGWLGTTASRFRVQGLEPAVDEALVQQNPHLRILSQKTLNPKPSLGARRDFGLWLVVFKLFGPETSQKTGFRV